ncbi:hypothetical protein FOZ61_006991 [Perkinsus olseni]|uniref:Uncharacterized protein n=1 Tax=Perkinsus olseni TaxID=32597 RepID=A0A7J6LRB8_PEROL|nr:hypothetical protein FOL46_005642 [Perkinsus olseni]KAF4668189.1 hypothetical protein FOZ61_006991 [Perkinsus olseni]
MWRAGVLIVNLLVIHVKLSNFCEGATGTARPYKNALVKMPIEDGHVTVNINGQDQHLRLDTGSSQLRVVDGDWYESRYGEDACLTPNKGCFYCPKEALCDFDKDPTLTTSHSADGSIIKSLSRHGSLTLGGEMYAHRYRKVFPSVLDTGSTALFLPLPTLLEDIVMELRRNLRAKGYEERVIASKYLLKDVPPSEYPQRSAAGKRTLWISLRPADDLPM